MKNVRTAGVLLHITSLNSPFGIGVMGREAFSFAEKLQRMSFRYWQVLPLVPVDASGSPELIAIREYSEFVEHGDVEALYNATQKLLVASVDKVEIAKAAHEKYSKEKMAEEYIKIYKKCI